VLVCLVVGSGVRKRDGRHRLRAVITLIIVCSIVGWKMRRLAKCIQCEMISARLRRETPRRICPSMCGAEEVDSHNVNFENLMGQL
jgi:hypothetical protein